MHEAPIRRSLAAAGILLTTLPAAAQSDLDQRLRVIERKLELQAEDAQAKAKEAPVPAAGDKGFSLKSADGAYELRIRALAQVDGRWWLSEDRPPSGNDTFLLRRLRPTFEGSAGKLVGFRLTPEFAGDGTGLAASIVDAYVDLRFNPLASVRVGKQKGPVGLERLQSGSAIEFVERGLPTELVPNRDIGVALFGEVGGGVFSYTLGVFNGTADGRDVATPDTDSREAGGRVFFEPFRNDPGLLQGLGFGVAGTHGTSAARLAMRRRSPPTPTRRCRAIAARGRTSSSIT